MIIVFSSLNGREKRMLEKNRNTTINGVCTISHNRFADQSEQVYESRMILRLFS